MAAMIVTGLPQCLHQARHTATLSWRDQEVKMIGYQHRGMHGTSVFASRLGYI